jgi:hypothetical protein
MAMRLARKPDDDPVGRAVFKRVADQHRETATGPKAVKASMRRF